MKKYFVSRRDAMHCVFTLCSALLVAAAFTFTSCGELDDPVREFNVTFQSNGGSAIEAVTVKEGDKVTKPTNPTRDGFAFVAWFKESAFTTEWKFDTDIVTANITLYAKWDQNTHTVTFNTNGGSNVDPQTVAEGAKATKPTNPVREGYTFAGWFKETTLDNEWNFDTDVVFAGITLYAKWLQDNTVTFNSSGAAAVDAQTVAAGTKVTRPTDPTRTVTFETLLSNNMAGLYLETPTYNYTFEGWFEDGKNELFDFDTPVNENITLVARWSPPNVSEVEPNDVGATIGYINENPGKYILLINDNVDTEANAIETSGVALTIIGIGSEREIRMTSDGSMFDLKTTGVELTIGNNITLVGLTDGVNGATANSSATLILVGEGAKLTILEGSKITGHTTTTQIATISTSEGSTLIMKGGIITENKSNFRNMSSQLRNVAGIRSAGDFFMEGGSIIGNAAKSTQMCVNDVFIHWSETSGNFTISGNAEIDFLSISTSTNTNPTSGCSPVIISQNWTGSVNTFNLTANHANVNNVIAYWTNKIAIVAAPGYTITPADIEKMGRVVFAGNLLPGRPMENTTFPTLMISISPENIGMVVEKPYN